MEGTPYIPERDPDLEILEKKKANLETIGSLVVEAKPEQANTHIAKEKLGHALLDMEVRKHEAETSFELDPAIRRRNAELDQLDNTHKESLDAILQKADSAIGTKDHVSVNASNHKARVLTSGKTTAQRRIVDIVMVSTIVILATLVVVLIFARN